MSLLLRRPVAAFLLAGLALAGCGGGAERSAASPSYPEAAKGAAQIVSDAQQAASSVKTFRVTGAMRQASHAFGVDMHFDGGSGAYGSISYAGVSFHVVRIGQALYFRAPAAFYAKAGSPTQVAAKVAGRWIKAPATSSSFRRFANFTSGAKFFGGVLGSAASVGMIKVPGVQVIGGKPAIALADPKDGSKLYIAAQGPALPLRIAGPAGSGSMDIVDYGQPVTLAAPRGALALHGANM